MILPDAPRRFTVEEYLLVERAAEFKSEFVDGQIFAMSGASRAHTLIAGNITGDLRNALRGSTCEVYQSDMRVQVADTGLFAYPDVVVACAPIELADTSADMLLSPVVIVEVLLPSTEAFDRGEKFMRYQRMPSLQHFLLVAQDAIRVEHFRRHGDAWLLEMYGSREEIIELGAIEVGLDVAGIYERVL